MGERGGERGAGAIQTRYYSKSQDEKGVGAITRLRSFEGLCLSYNCTANFAATIAQSCGSSPPARYVSDRPDNTAAADFGTFNFISWGL